MLHQDLHHEIREAPASEIQTKDRTWERVALVDGHSVRNESPLSVKIFIM